jgi:hypothetical protein
VSEGIWFLGQIGLNEDLRATREKDDLDELLRLACHPRTLGPLRHLFGTGHVEADAQTAQIMLSFFC